MEKDVETLVKQITYKPGYHISIVDKYNHGIVTIRFQTVSVLCSSGNTNKAPFPLVKYCTYNREFIQNINEEMLIAIIFRELEELELHEVKEWFKYKGKHYKEPHPENIPVKV